MSFYFCNGIWSGDQDTLKVLTRESKSAEWQVLATTYKSVSSWEEMTIELGHNSATAQIAFEGHGGDGYGIIIDMLKIEESQVMTNPIISSVEEGYTSLKFSWTKSSLAVKTQIVVSETNLSESALADETPVEVTGTSYTISDLQSGVKRYIFIRTVDGNNNVSDWVSTSGTTISRRITTNVTRYAWKTEYAWTQKELVDKYQIVISYDELTSEELEDAEKMEYTNADNDYLEFAPQFDKIGHIFIRAKFSDIGFGNWQHDTFHTPCWIADMTIKQAYSSAVVLGWGKYTNETLWKVYICEEGEEPPSPNTLSSYYTFNQQETTQYDLTTGKTYTLCVAPIDPNNSERIGPWTKLNFSTKSGKSSFDVTDETPYIEDFETAAPEWTRVQESNYKSYIGSGLRAYRDAPVYNMNLSTSPYEGEQNAFFYHYNSGAGSAQLISPVLNISGVSKPRLSFYYQNLSWSGDTDEFAVYYRTASNEDWVELMDNMESAQTWTLKEFDLTEKSSTFQVMFEGSGNVGYGILLDNVKIQNFIATDIAETANDSDVRVWTEQGCIRVANASGIVSVTNIIGQNIASKVGDELTFSVSSGVYIVQTEEGTFKVIVK